jgi:hypothetical protein
MASGRLGRMLLRVYVGLCIAWLATPFAMLIMILRARRYGALAPDPSTGRIYPIGVGRRFGISYTKYMTEDFSFAYTIVEFLFFGGMAMILCFTIGVFIRRWWRQGAHNA